MANEKKNTELSYAERLDIPRVSLKEAKEQIKLSLQYRQRRGCIILVGESGLGKTQIFHQLCTEENYRLYPIHTAHYGLMGSGIPRKAEGEYFKIAVPDCFPKEGEKAIVLFDELNRGLKHAIAMFFTMLEDGSMFNYRLPEDCLVVATMNPDTAAYTVTNIENEAAIRRRVKFMWVTSDFKGWMEHAKTPMFHSGSFGPARDKPCHPEILDYFRANPKRLYDDKAQKTGKQYLCPATVETISEDAYNLQAAGLSLFDDMAQTRYAASVGVHAATQISEHIKDSSVLLNASDVLEGYNKATRTAVGKIKANSQEEKLADLCENVLELMFADQLEVAPTAKCFLKFCRDLPEEIAANMLFQMKESAVRADARPYLDSLMGELQNYEDWIDIQLKLDKNHRQIDDELRQK